MAERTVYVYTITARADRPSRGQLTFVATFDTWSQALNETAKAQSGQWFAMLQGKTWYLTRYVVDEQGQHTWQHRQMGAFTPDLARYGVSMFGLGGPGF